MLGGIALLGVLALISKAIADYGFEKLFIGTVDRLREKGTSLDEIRRKIQGYPISRELKLKILDHLNGLEGPEDQATPV
ncbi:hypothetical protein [Chondromyces crocatus]|uniref:Uncharacterized protein n=1 Tax=Chondromyces crocatus TaxID=52 RepID=A0A0K1EBY4_CHOCO|nr:hypothetical protein [Chondromyces crocatus]AKT38401.1 uncharacterized protein CMC5_025470 [Chondromyces crocatus]